MKNILILTLMLASAGLVPADEKTTSVAPPKPDKPRIEVCFVLDTTGSMGGLIEGAKQKIWSISNQIVKAKPTPELKIGLVAYRDRGDEYIAKPYALTTDIDTVYANLMKFSAAGGGDGPESVNEALAVAVNKMEWSNDSNVLKIIFLVGDAPPHMDYPDDVKYPVTCQVAVKKNIIINTVQCGGEADTTPEWQKVAVLSEGKFTAIGQEGDVAVIATPMDAKLAELNTAIGKTLVPYGKEEKRREVAEKQAMAATGFATPANAPAAADRLAYNVATSKAVQGGNELVEDYKKDKDVVASLKPADLPAELKGKKPAEIEAYLVAQQKTRDELQKQIGELGRQREQYIADEKKKLAGKKDGFDEQVAKILRDEAQKKGLRYE